MSQHAVVVVDLQNEYLPTGKLGLTGIEQALANAARVIAQAREHKLPVIHIRHESLEADAPIFQAGTPNVDIIEQVAAQAGEAVITKNYPNAFRQTKLKQTLDQQGIEAITVIGAMSHMCIDATARAAADFGYQVTVVHDACATLDLEFGGQVVPAAQVHAAEMAALAFGYAKLVSTGEYLAQQS